MTSRTLATPGRDDWIVSQIKAIGEEFDEGPWKDAARRTGGIQPMASSIQVIGLSRRLQQDDPQPGGTLARNPTPNPATRMIEVDGTRLKA